MNMKSNKRMETCTYITSTYTRWSDFLFARMKKIIDGEAVTVEFVVLKVQCVGFKGIYL